jgi:hypothetical protein
MKKYYMQSNRIARFCMQYNGGRITGLVTSCLLKHVFEESFKGQEDNEEDYADTAGS